MQIDMPKLSLALGVLVTLETAVGGGVLSLSNAVPASAVPTVQAWCNLLAFAGSTILTALHAFSGPSSGVLASPPTMAQAQQIVTAAKAAATVAVLAIILTAFSPGLALAQDRTPTPRPAPAKIGGPVGNVLDKIQGQNAPTAQPGGDFKLTGDPVADLHAAIKRGGAKLILHLKQSYALAMSKSTGGNNDNTSAMCTKALVPIVDLVINGPKPGTLADGDAMALSADEQALAADTSEPEGIIVKIEKLRILRLALQGPALNDACGALVQDEVKNAQNLVGKLTSLITGAGMVGLGL